MIILLLTYLFYRVIVLFMGSATGAAELEKIMKSAATIIKNAVNGIYMAGVMQRKGWSKQQAADAVLEWLTSGSKASIHDFMESK